MIIENATDAARYARAWANRPGARSYLKIAAESCRAIAAQIDRTAPKAATAQRAAAEVLEHAVIRETVAKYAARTIAAGRRLEQAAADEVLTAASRKIATATTKRRQP
jgi:hypothetical protein